VAQVEMVVLLVPLETKVQLALLEIQEILEQMESVAKVELQVLLELLAIKVPLVPQEILVILAIME
jgi:hypothetical protein